MKRNIALSGAVWFVMTLSSVLVAQLPTATILGVVRDSSGAVVPQANVTARNVDTGQTRTVVTAADGSYRLPSLPVGNYELRVEHEGFQSSVHGGLSLSVGQEAVVNIALQVGAVEQTVSVTGEAPLVNTTSGTLGGLVDEKRMAELPLNGRNFVDLTFLQTGVQRDPASKSGGPIMRGDWFSGNGAPGRSNNFLLDGALMTNLNGNGPSTNADWSPGVEGIREFRVVTNSFSAEYGLKMGAQVMIASKGGTNAFHGSLFEYLRNSALDARNFFDRKTAVTPRRLPPFVRNNFGGSVGGPIREDQVFFFGTFEGLRERLGTTQIANVIPASAKVNGGLVPEISPVTRPFLQIYPDPNLPGNQFTYSPVQPTNGQYGQARIDASLSASDSIFGRYTIQDSELIVPTNIPRFADERTSRGQFATLSESHIFSPSLLNTFRFSYSRTNDAGNNAFEPSGPEFAFVPGLGMGTILIGGLTGIGPSNVNPLVAKQNVFSWNDDVFYTRGRHSLKFGTAINRYQQYSLTGTALRGQIIFADLASFLQAGPVVSYNAVTAGSVIDRSWEFTTLGFYAQDDVRVNSNLTLNLGLRYEFHTTFQETRGKGSSLRDLVRDAAFTVGPLFKNPSLRNFSPRFGFAWDVKGDGKTALRGGLAVMYDVGTGIGGAIITTTALPPFAGSSAVPSSPRLTLPLAFPSGATGKTTRPMQWEVDNPHIVQYNLTLERQLPAQTALTLAYAGSRGLNLLQRYEGNPTIPQVLADGRKFWLGNEPRVNPNWDSMELKDTSGDSWYNSFQFSLLKRLSHGLQFQSSYTWAKVLDNTQSQIQEVSGATSDSPPPDPLNRRLDKAPARFDATQNLRFNALYRLPESNRLGTVAGKLLNGWWISGILALQDGFPVNVIVQSNRSRSKTGIGGFGTTNDRPDLVAGRNGENMISGTTAGCPGVASGRKLGGPDLYYDPCAFALQPAGFLGTAGRNLIRGPGLANVDFSLVKDTALRSLGEGGKLEFRAEIFNILNRVNFSFPGTIAFAGARDGEPRLPTAGIITSTVTTSRQVQFALKLLF
ncbi:MAG: TonB-dependent receptor [Acidobacteria bacterium]|nr:TonB-dependent receptor [Acidobacteriota bacterium]